MAINTRSVRFRTTAGAALALALLLTVAGIAINWSVAREIQRSFDATLMEQAADRAALLGTGAPPESLMTVTGDEVIVLALDSNRQVLASAGIAEPQAVAGLVPGVQDAEVLVDEDDEVPYRETLRVAVARAPDGSTIVVGNEGESSREAISRVRNTLLAGVPLVGLAGALVAWFVTGRALEPVKRMRRDLDEVVHAGDGQRVQQPATRDEIDELAASINGVLNRLDHQSSVRRQFVADASHELKSPLANARVLLDTAARPPDPSEFDRVSAGVQAELRRLQALVDDLLYLAQEDETAPASPQTIDLDDLVFNEAERVAAQSPKRVDASSVVPARVVADPQQVSRAIRNLVENAERYAETRVRLAIETRDRQAVVVVADDGPGIPAAERQRVFERFARLSGDRARTDGGTGLGLAIVAAIAESNGGTVRLAESADGGARFELALPLAV